MALAIKRNFGVSWKIVCLTVIVFAGLTYLFPFTLDDWAWGSQEGIDRLTSGFAAYNGRYFSNILVIVMTRSILLRCLLSGACVAAMLCAVSYLANGTALAYWGSAALLLFVPTSIRAQTLVWTSGFTNYVTSALVVLLVLALSKAIESKGEEGLRTAAAAGATGFLGSLIVENVTLALVIISAWLNLRFFLKNRAACRSYVVLLLASVAATALMFSNSAYAIVAAGDDSYRSMSQDGPLHNALSNFAEEISPLIFSDNLLLPTCVLVGMICSSRLLPQRSKLHSFALHGATATLIASFALSFFSIGSRSGIGALFQSGLCLLFYLTVVFHCVLLSKELRDSLLFDTCLLAVLLTGPLLFVNPVSPRTVLPTYVVILAIALSLMSKGLEKRVADKALRFAGATALSGLLAWVVIYAQIHVADTTRLSDAFEQASSGQEEIVVDRLPFESSTWHSSINQERWQNFYKQFYGLPADSSVRFE